MTDGYWNRQQPPFLPSGGILKRPRSDCDHTPSGPSPIHEIYSYYARDNDFHRYQAMKDTRTINSAYDHYLQNVQSLTSSSKVAGPLSGAGLGSAVSSRRTGIAIADSALISRSRVAEPDLEPNGRDIGFHGQSQVDKITRQSCETVPLPPDASNTIYVEGLPSDCTRREVAHIFRPFVGYKELRLVTKESKHRSRDPIILCFVDFASAACAATAMSALQGYKMDENDPDSAYLRLQFSRHPGPRSGSTSLARR